MQKTYKLKYVKRIETANYVVLKTASATHFNKQNDWHGKFVRILNAFGNRFIVMHRDGILKIQKYLVVIATVCSVGENLPVVRVMCIATNLPAHLCLVR